MFKFTQIAIAAAMTVTVLGSSMTSSQAAGAMPIAPIATTQGNVAEVGYRHRRHWGHKRHYRSHYRPYYRPYYSSYRPHCFWKKRKVWSDYYGYYVFKRVKVCR